MSHVAAIVGSPSATSRTADLTAWVGERLNASGHTVDTIHLRTLPAAALIAADASDPVLADAIGRVRKAHGLLVATPIYQASYSGVLKTFLDVLPQRALVGKTVLPLATAGSAAHVLAIDYALRPVLAALGADHISPGWVCVAGSGDPGEGVPANSPAPHGGSPDRALQNFHESLGTVRSYQHGIEPESRALWSAERTALPSRSTVPSV